MEFRNTLGCCLLLLTAALISPVLASEQPQRVREIPLLENMSFREVGYPVPDLYPGGVFDHSQPVHSGRDYSVSRLLEQVQVSQDHNRYSDENLTYEAIFPSDPLGPRGTITPWGFTTWGQSASKSHWTIEGEIGLVTGSATYADNEGQLFSLVETLTTPSGNTFEFYQGYTVDHSYINGRELVIGAEQEFKDTLWDGDLQLTEEFTEYTDLGNANNNRQRGLFELKFDPEFDGGRWKTDLQYKYIVKTYDIFSTRSYIYNSGRLDLEYAVSNSVKAEGRIRLDDYNYSVGSDRGHNRLSYGSTWDWQASADLELSASADHQQKNYNNRQDRSYDKLKYEASARWKPDNRSVIDLTAATTDYNREFDPLQDYDDSRIELQIQRVVNDWFDISAWYLERDKEYSADPTRDLDLKQSRLAANITPNKNLDLSADWTGSKYNYANPLRVFELNAWSVSAGYSLDGLRASAGYSQRKNSYVADPARNYRQQFVDTGLDYRFDRHRIRVYYAVGELEQTNPASTNSFTETRLGGEWNFEIDENVDFRLSYQDSERSYDSWGDIRDERLDAVLSFEL